MTCHCTTIARCSHTRCSRKQRPRLRCYCTLLATVVLLSGVLSAPNATVVGHDYIYTLSDALPVPTEERKRELFNGLLQGCVERIFRDTL